MNILYGMIHERSESAWTGNKVAVDNFPLWEKHWFAVAQALKEDFEKEGLMDTAQAIDNIIIEQRKFLPAETKSIPVGKKESEPVLESETGFENEGILPDDYPIYGDYLYVCDGKPYRSIWNNVTVARLKLLEKFKEVRRCNITARRRAFLIGK